MLGNKHGNAERRWPLLHRIGEIAALPFSAMGRKRLWVGVRLRVWPFSYPLASFYRRFIIRRTHVICVIGSFGKTTTTRAVATVLGQSSSRLGWGFNARGLLAEEVLRIRRRSPRVVLEVGTKHKGSMQRNARLLRPDLVVVTSIGSEHHKTLGPIAEIRNEKAEMLRQLPAVGSAIVNGDDVNVRWMARQTLATVTTFGFAEANDIRASNYHSEGLSGGRFDLHVAGQLRTVCMKLVGRHQVYALLAAVAVSQAEHMDLDESVRAIEAFQPTRRRLWPLRLESGAGLLLDTYKSVFETVDVALDALEGIPAPHKIVVLGEIFEPPKSEDEIYSYLGRRVAQIADGTVFIGKESAFQSLRNGAGPKGATIASAQESVHEAARLVKGMITSQSVVLLKGLGSLGMERIALLLTGEAVVCRRISCNVANTWECGGCPFLH
jgi:UDP-N-acetylmuramoyl-tripeptide--D-alanyl-D-alanine ligase